MNKQGDKISTIHTLTNPNKKSDVLRIVNGIKNNSSVSSSTSKASSKKR